MKGAYTMTDISNELVDIISQNNCSPVYALFLLSEDNKDEQSNVSTISTAEKWDNLGTRN